MKIALIHCPLWGTFDPPIGLAQLSSYLKEQGYEVELFDLNIKLYLNQAEDNKTIWAWDKSDFWYQPESVKKFFLDNFEFVNHYLERVLKGNIRIAAFSVNTASRLFSLEFAQRLKEQSREITIIFGGPVFLNKNFVHNILQEGCVDIAIAGEGLRVFSNLLNTLNLGKDINSCKGIVFKQDGTVIDTGPAPGVNLDNLPFLDLADLPLKDYDAGRHISLMTSRGCVRRCVFCSDAPCWSGFKAMSGRRIFEELKFHKDKYKVGHIDFMDLAFNGNMNSLIEFCDLMIEAKLDVGWTANMYVRPEVTHKVIKKMSLAKCEHVIIGIESGSERVLRLMNKYYNITDAERIIRQMYDEGICVTANFMFGFPGETEEDFELTLDFLRRNGKYMGVYPSRTYCALEEFSYLQNHQEEFGIKPNPPNYLFWEDLEGKNTYPLRMERCRRFCQLAFDLGVEVTAGVQTTVELDEWFNLGHYYESVKDYPKAIENFLNYFREDPTNTIVKDKLLALHNKLPKTGFNNIKEDFKKTVAAIVREKIVAKKMRTDRPLSSAFVKMQMERLNDEIEKLKKKTVAQVDAILLISKIDKVIRQYRSLNERQQFNLSIRFNQFMKQICTLSLREANQRSNEAEFIAKKVYLDSFPVNVYLLFLDKRCDFHYIFEPQDENRSGFSLAHFKEYIEPKIGLLLLFAQRCIFKGGGDFSLNEESIEILDFFQQMYPFLEKEFFTNGVNFSTEAIDKLVGYTSSYIINFSLHASNQDLHRQISNKDNFNEIKANLELLSDIRKKSKNIVLNIIYTATTLNIVDLPSVIGLAANFKVDKVSVDYNRISTPEQKDISCFFKQDLTNEIFDIVQIQAKRLNLPLHLPPKFNQGTYPKAIVCNRPWSQIVLDVEGNIFPCEHFGDWNIKLQDKESLGKTWNGLEYKAMRGCFNKFGCSECSAFCYYANPSQVNSLRSHIFNFNHFNNFENSQKLKEDLKPDLNKDEIERLLDLADFLFSHEDLSSSERIIKGIVGKMQYPSRAFRILAGIYRERAEFVNSISEREHFLKLAQEEIEKSLASWASDPCAYTEAARIHSLLNHHTQVKEAIRKAIALSPEERRVELLKLEQELIKN